AKHARIDLTIACAGDTRVDDHHTVEDVGIALGQALKDALADLRGVTRFGDCALPMDEALVLAAVDLSGRGTLGFAADLLSQKVGTFDTELVKEFFLALTREARMTLHLRQLAGENTHHILEAMFKGAGRALRQAAAIDPAFARDIPSTKGTLGGKA
ncbi:MAG: imidazoleglycerol-phosphate dehydratase, partial [Firmicutes bacterium]|nr:imidazoleglycerol-phosphate dehydratase [Bacillota bacterium]